MKKSMRFSLPYVYFAFLFLVIATVEICYGETDYLSLSAAVIMSVATFFNHKTTDWIFGIVFTLSCGYLLLAGISELSEFKSFTTNALNLLVGLTVILISSFVSLLFFKRPLHDMTKQSGKTGYAPK